MKPCTVLLILALSFVAAAGEAAPTITEFKGDQRIVTDTVWRDGEYHVYGNLVLAGGTLTVENATVQVMSEYARHRKVQWEGGRLVTRNSLIGGRKHEGVFAPTVFELYDGEWLATDTTVQYSTGIVFSYEKTSKFYATRLQAGENPDSVIVCGKADVKFVDSEFDVALHLPAYTGGENTLDLPLGEPISMVFDEKIIPGLGYRFEMVNSTVPTLWFLFFIAVQSDGPVTHYKLRNVTNVVPGWTAIDLKATAVFPASWRGDEWPGEWNPMPAGSEVSIGSLRVTTLTDKTIFAGWGVYLNGPETDVTIQGSTTICELAVSQGKCRVLGTEGKHDIWLACTSTDATDGARIEVHNANLAYPEPSPHYKHIRAEGEGSHVILDDVVFGDRLELIANEGGRIELREWSGNKAGVKETTDGGKITWTTGDAIVKTGQP